MVETGSEEVELTAAERDSFLTGVDTGVLSLSTIADDPPHSIPVSFGYNAEQNAFFFRLADLPPQRKGELDGRSVTFVTYADETEFGGYASVVAQGTLEPTSGTETATEALSGLEDVTIPFVDIFGDPPKDVSFSFYRLVPESLTGRKETTTEL